MPDRPTSRLLAFSVDKAAIEQLEAIFREARGQIERQVRDRCEARYQERLAEISDDMPSERRLERVEYLKNWRTDEMEKQLNETDVTYVISQSNGIKGVKLDSVADLLNLPNWRDRSITSLVVEIGSYSTLSMTVNINAKGFIETIDYRVRGDLPSVEYYSGKLDQWMISIQRWYSGIYRALRSPASGLLITPLLAVILYASYLEVLALRIDQSLWWMVIILVVSNMVLIGLLLWGAFLTFPVGEFAIGDGIRRKRIRDTAAKVIAVPIALAIVVGIISGVIANKFTTR
jgi:hypothetical protein